MAQVVLTTLTNDSKSADKDNDIGHYSDKELAYIYLKINDKDNALDHAQIEYNRRPDNIDVEQTLAWVHYKRGEYKQAYDLITRATRTHSQNAVLLYEAGLIFEKNNKASDGKVLMSKALAIDPYLSPDLLNEGNRKDISFNR